MNPDDAFSLDAPTRDSLWRQVVAAIEAYHAGVPKAPVAPAADPQRIRSLLAAVDFIRPLDPREAVDFVVQNLWDHQVHTPHPRYFGLFNPAPTPMSIAADTLVAAFNPQLATLSHSPFAVEVERLLVRAFAARFGFGTSTTNGEGADGTFASGGAEANHTAMLTALVHVFPEYAQKGARGLAGQPVLYVSTQSHHSFVKAARACGLGDEAVRRVPVDEALRMDPGALRRMIAGDRAAGLAPFLVVGTAGTTNAGTIDPLAALAEVAEGERMWFHADAAWGGAAVFVPELRPLLEGIGLADSITFDAHKWLSVPMAAGIYLTRHRDILGRTFGISTEYMPGGAPGTGTPDPYTHSIQWSRRFIGLKVFLSLAVAGWEGYEAVIRHQTAMGDLLRRGLEAAGWRVVNRTKLPVVCFVDGRSRAGESAGYLQAVAGEVVSSGEAWLSVTRLDGNVPVLRACITNYRTDPEDVHALVRALGAARGRLSLRGDF